MMMMMMIIIIITIIIITLYDRDRVTLNRKHHSHTIHRLHSRCVNLYHVLARLPFSSSLHSQLINPRARFTQYGLVQLSPIHSVFSPKWHPPCPHLINFDIDALPVTYLVSQFASVAITVQRPSSNRSTVRYVVPSVRLFLGWAATCVAGEDGNE